MYNVIYVNKPSNAANAEILPYTAMDYKLTAIHNHETQDTYCFAGEEADVNRFINAHPTICQKILDGDILFAIACEHRDALAKRKAALANFSSRITGCTR